ncbi:MAG: hypothetical protein ACO3A4_09970 [Silvanigrellaceae bacterium]
MRFSCFLLAMPFCWTAAAKAEVVSAVSASSGLILANISGYRVGQDSISKNFDAKWLSFRSRILAAVGEFQVGLSSKFKATQLMETRTGIQYYPFSYGADFEDFHESTIMRYSSSLKPYLAAKVGYGRYLISIVDDLGSAEVSSNYFSVGGAFGTVYQFSQSAGLDLNVDASMALGTSEVAFTGIILRPRFGLLLYL